MDATLKDLTESHFRDIYNHGTATFGGEVLTKTASSHPEVDSYGEGLETDAWLVFEYRGAYYKKWGYFDSYGGSYWDGGLNEVQPKTKIVEVWE